MYLFVWAHTYTPLLNLVVTMENRTVRGVLQATENKYLSVHSFIQQIHMNTYCAPDKTLRPGEAPVEYSR